MVSEAQVASEPILNVYIFHYLQYNDGWGEEQWVTDADGYGWPGLGSRLQLVNITWTNFTILLTLSVEGLKIFIVFA